MNDCDQVRLINVRKAYEKDGLALGMTGFIMDPRCIEGQRLVSFSGGVLQASNGIWYTTDIECPVYEEDLEVIRERPRENS